MVLQGIQNDMKSALLEPFKIKNIPIKNKITACPPPSYLATEIGEVTTKLVNFYRKITLANPGIVLIEPCAIDYTNKGWPNQLNADSPEAIINFSKLLEVIRKNNSIPFISLDHQGAQSIKNNFGKKYAPSILNEADSSILELDYQNIQAIEKKYIEAAITAWNSGFSGIELQGADGSLLHQFISPLTNKRFDEYSLNSGNPFLFPINIVKAIRKAIPDLILSYRIPLKDYLPGGLNLNESIKLANLLSNCGIDLFHVSGGMQINRTGSNSIIGRNYPDAFFKEDSKIFKSQIDKPIIFSGKISSPKVGEQILLDNCSDMISLSTELIRDPDWIINCSYEGNKNVSKCLLCPSCVAINSSCPDGKNKDFWTSIPEDNFS